MEEMVALGMGEAEKGVRDDVCWCSSRWVCAFLYIWVLLFVIGNTERVTWLILLNEGYMHREWERSTW